MRAKISKVDVLLEELYNTKTRHDKYDFNVISGDDKKSAIAKTVYEWADKNVSDEDVELAKRVAELEAKVYAYEAIIANSNFSPVIKNRDLDTFNKVKKEIFYYRDNIRDKVQNETCERILDILERAEIWRL